MYEKPGYPEQPVLVGDRDPFADREPAGRALQKRHPGPRVPSLLYGSFFDDPIFYGLFPRPGQKKVRPEKEGGEFFSGEGQPEKGFFWAGCLIPIRHSLGVPWLPGHYFFIPLVYFQDYRERKMERPSDFGLPYGGVFLSSFCCIAAGAVAQRDFGDVRKPAWNSGTLLS
jgi:hypothetical protein